ncbi:DEAD-domain-containing protein [Pseudovirgaria hyperparasitica]|uniref:RNA helicase n=1 Tax=Pseudovirgaria hyperparasitica TaxID=470096 RepID=A0A6A6W1J3_9PEZI|nr:DEAD-domain-containing protein [Pseudovirgaria hyperparasitica]KAF2755800.1 DEAD-domain-containing protein [Pseudovirgaria hyperparasitica]
MGKRSLGDAIEPAESLVRKKSKKNKHGDIPPESETATIVTAAPFKLAKTKSTTEAKSKTVNKEKQSGTSFVDDEESQKKAKAARKEAKRAKKAALAAQNTPPLKNDLTENDTANEDAKATRKAARRAEKEQAKTEKLNKSLGTPKSSGDVNTAASIPLKSSTKSAFRYVQNSELAALSQAAIDKYLASNEITITDPLSQSSLRPITQFSYLPISDKSQLAPFASFDSPTPIQAAAWPCLLSGRDVIGVAETGSGKTFAFGVPCIQAILATVKMGPTVNGVRALVVSPTRELASQIHEQITQIAKPAGLHVACIYGGVPKEPQYEAMKKANIVVATPGRLNDLISEGVVDLGQVQYMVLDEADRMLEKGFEEEIKKIIGQTLPVGRQTLMFTATWPPSVRDLAMTFMNNPIKISIGDNPTGELRANTRIIQQVEVVEPYVKNTRLMELLKQHQSGRKKDDRILVFCLYKKEATRVEGFIKSKGFRVAGIHGDLSQAQRTASLDSFKKGSVPILVATDVAARGLDIPAVKVVINVTFPLTAEDYVHRIGRTGRAGQDGLAVTLFTEHDKGLSGALINVLKAANQPVPEELLKFGGTVKKKGHEAYGAFYKDTGDMKKATKITFD